MPSNPGMGGPGSSFQVDAAGWPRLWGGSEWFATGNHPPSGVHLMFARPPAHMSPSDYREFSYPLPGATMPVQIKNQDGKGACFPAGVRVSMADGTYRPIEDIRLMDRVLTAEGCLRPVIKTMVRVEEEALYRLEVWGRPPLRATGDHPILTPGGYIRADRLERGDHVTLPTYDPDTTDQQAPTRPIAGVIREPFRGPVYNLEVDTDNSYVAEGIGVHNCNGHAAASTLELSRWVAGLTHVDLSAWFVYAILCNGVDRGSSIDDALKLLTETGTCPDDDVPYGTINPKALTPENYGAAARFKIEVGTKLESWDDLMAATMLGRPFNFSICVGSNFNNLDSHGAVGFTNGYGNHAVSGGWGAKPIGGGEWAIKFQNSWGTGWGQGGLAYFTRKHWEHQQYAAAYDLVAVTDDPSDPEKFPTPTNPAYERPGVITPAAPTTTFPPRG